MTIIKIDRNTIKKNPNAGSTRTMVKGRKEVSFVVKGALPDFMIDGVNIHITEWSDTEYSGVLINHDDVKLISGVQGITYRITEDIQVIDHLPESEYFYSYENPEILCVNCGNKMLLSEISEDEDYDDEGNSYTICPYCKEINTFESKYESISDVIKTKDAQ